MIAMPWYLLAGGIVLVIIGYLMAGLSRAKGSKQRVIDSEMDDDEIAEELRGSQRVSFPGVVILLGFLCILVSIVWRLGRMFF